MERESTPYATPEAGYSNLRENPASGATGSAKVGATASHSSGDFTPRALDRELRRARRRQRVVALGVEQRLELGQRHF